MQEPDIGFRLGNEGTTCMMPASNTTTSQWHRPRQGQKRRQRCLFAVGCAALLLLATDCAASTLVRRDVEQECQEDEDCRIFYNTTVSKCLPETSTCSSPYVEGCLRAHLGSDVEKRSCNSDDGTNKDFCSTLQVNAEVYPEVRIHNGDWESSIFLAWIHQIVLSEMVGVPTTVGLTRDVTHVSSFYSDENVIVYSEALYPWDALRTADASWDKETGEGGCTIVTAPCVDFLPEVVPGQDADFLKLLEDKVIDNPSTNGLLGLSGLHIPTFTAEAHPDLAIWFGFQGTDKRELLASLFKRPTSWQEYCTEVSLTGCTEPDETAKRAPSIPEENDMYFMQDVFQGYFRYTEKSNCTARPNTCSGAVLNTPCDWSNYLEGQLYWNGIVGLDFDGPLEVNGGYSGSQLIEIWMAANATKSHVVMQWYEPDPLPTLFLGTDFEFQQVALPAVSSECLKFRPTTEERCSEDSTLRRGDPRGACRNNVQNLQKIMTKSLAQINLEKENEAEHSPAPELLKNIRVTNLDMSSILSKWNSGIGAREAVCDWVVENQERLASVIPAGYPRNYKDRDGNEYAVYYLYLAIGIGDAVGIMSLIALFVCYRYRDSKTMIFAQPLFMMLILIGFGLVSLGAVFYAFQPSDSYCLAAAWLIVLGYSIELVAVLVKTSAINKLVHSSKKMKRVTISRKVMLFKLSGVLFFVFGFLLAWTFIDMPVAKETLIIEDNGVEVSFEVKCASDSYVWRLVSFGWQALLLVLAAYLAFQSRDVMDQLNESTSLAMMVYSHFLFVCLRGILFVFYVYDTMPASATAALLSLNFSLDVFFAMCIYVFPKIWEALSGPSDYRARRFSFDSRFSATSARQSAGLNSKMTDTDEAPTSYNDRSPSGALKILVCSANIGNQEPSENSFEAWIPAGGSCDRIKPLDKESVVAGRFDVVAIGMQEATWAESKRSGRISTIKGDTITEEEILMALEEKNTVRLRELTQATLGDAYYQLLEEQRGQMRLHIWVRRDIVKDIEDIKLSGANTGIGNMLANKGGIVATLYYRQTRITFLAAHLAAHEGRSYYKARCDNVRSILREATTFGLSKKLDPTMYSHHMFVLGDLNFRTNFGEENSHEENVKRALKLIEAKDYQTLYSFDELQEGLAEGDFLMDFKTLPCNFPPTFKVEREAGFVYKEQRTPSYTDRILYKSSEGLSANLNPLAYESCVDFITSDHKPVRGAFTVVPNEKMRPLRIDGELNLVFRKLKCSNLPAGDSDGSSDPYLMFLWDGVELQCGNKSLVDKIRQLWAGSSWPRTAYISKTLNPYWKGTRMEFNAIDCAIGSDAMMFLCVIDFDAVGKDECLGVLPLNLREICRMRKRETEKTVVIDRPLMFGGKAAGRIKLKIDVSLYQFRRNSSRRLGGMGPRRRSIAAGLTDRRDDDDDS